MQIEKRRLQPLAKLATDIEKSGAAWPAQKLAPSRGEENTADLLDIDRLSQRYYGRPFRNREQKRLSAWIEVDRWHGW